MALNLKEKEKIVKQFAQNPKDTGSVEVQVALLSNEIKDLTSHLKKHPKDHSSRRGLLRMVTKRKRLLNYLEKESKRRFNKLVKNLKI